MDGRAEALEFRAEVNGGIKPGVQADGREHADRGALAVGSGDIDYGGKLTVQKSQPVGSLQSWNARLSSCKQLRIIRRNSGRKDHGIRPEAADVFAFLGESDLRAKRAELIAKIVGVIIRAADLLPTRQSQFGQAGHADAPDADKPDALAGREQSLVRMKVV